MTSNSDSDTQQITATMPKELKEKWLAALRSGEYEQGKDSLYNGNSYCCLGVLQKVADGDVERDSNGRDLVLPSRIWGVEHLCTADGNPEFDPFLPSLKEKRIQGHQSCSLANDGGYAFPEIADAIELHVQGV